MSAIFRTFFSLVDLRRATEVWVSEGLEVEDVSGMFKFSKAVVRTVLGGPEISVGSD